MAGIRSSHSILKKALSAVICICFLSSVVLPPQTAGAQVLPTLPMPGAMLNPTPGYLPALIKGITVHPENPLEFDFIIDPGQDGLRGEALRTEADRMIRYFLASLTVPEDQMWVNLSPEEQDRIISDHFGRTAMGMDMLAQDYLLKQLTASLMYPEEELGKEFWQRVHKRAQKEFGTSDIPVDTFNKVWIVPQDASVYVKDNHAFIIKSRMDVMLEQDYEAQQAGRTAQESASVKNIDDQIIREIIIPEIKKEINEGKTFARLRQMYQAMVLAAWYKLNLRESLLGKIYVDRNKTAGVETKTPEEKEKIYEQYLKAFKQGVYNYIKEEHDPATGKTIPRKYFSGGYSNTGPDQAQLSDKVRQQVVRFPNATPAQRSAARRAIPIGDDRSADGPVVVRVGLLDDTRDSAQKIAAESARLAFLDQTDDLAMLSGEKGQAFRSVWKKMGSSFQKDGSFINGMSETSFRQLIAQAVELIPAVAREENEAALSTLAKNLKKVYDNDTLPDVLRDGAEMIRRMVAQQVLAMREQRRKTAEQAEHDPSDPSWARLAAEAQETATTPEEALRRMSDEAMLTVVDAQRMFFDSVQELAREKGFSWANKSKIVDKVASYVDAGMWDHNREQAINLIKKRGRFSSEEEAEGFFAEAVQAYELRRDVREQLHAKMGRLGLMVSEDAYNKVIMDELLPKAMDMVQNGRDFLLLITQNEETAQGEYLGTFDGEYSRYSTGVGEGRANYAKELVQPAQLAVIDGGKVYDPEGSVLQVLQTLDRSRSDSAEYQKAKEALQESHKPDFVLARKVRNEIREKVPPKTTVDMDSGEEIENNRDRNEEYHLTSILREAWELRLQGQGFDIRYMPAQGFVRTDYSSVIQQTLTFTQEVESEQFQVVSNGEKVQDLPEGVNPAARTIGLEVDKKLEADQEEEADRAMLGYGLSFLSEKDWRQLILQIELPQGDEQSVMLADRTVFVGRGLTADDVSSILGRLGSSKVDPAKVQRIVLTDFEKPDAVFEALHNTLFLDRRAIRSGGDLIVAGVSENVMKLDRQTFFDLVREHFDIKLSMTDDWKDSEKGRTDRAMLTKLEIAAPTAKQVLRAGLDRSDWDAQAAAAAVIRLYGEDPLFQSLQNKAEDRVISFFRRASRESGAIVLALLLTPEFRSEQGDRVLAEKVKSIFEQNDFEAAAIAALTMLNHDDIEAFDELWNPVVDVIENFLKEKAFETAAISAYAVLTHPEIEEFEKLRDLAYRKLEKLVRSDKTLTRATVLSAGALLGSDIFLGGNSPFSQDMRERAVDVLSHAVVKGEGRPNVRVYASAITIYLVNQLKESRNDAAMLARLKNEGHKPIIDSIVQAETDIEQGDMIMALRDAARDAEDENIRAKAVYILNKLSNQSGINHMLHQANQSFPAIMLGKLKEDVPDPFSVDASMLSAEDSEWEPLAGLGPEEQREVETLVRGLLPPQSDAEDAVLDFVGKYLHSEDGMYPFMNALLYFLKENDLPRVEKFLGQLHALGIKPGTEEESSDEAILTDIHSNARVSTLTPIDETRPVKFGTSGDRGKLKTEENPDGDFNTNHVARLAQGTANWFKKAHPDGKVLVGYDPRQGNPEFARLTAQIMAANGIRVKIVAAEPTPTPVLAYLGGSDAEVEGVINFTASHNPYTDDGMKFSPGHGGASDKEITDGLTAEANALDEYAALDYDQAVEEGLVEIVTAQQARDRYLDRYLIPRLQEIGAWDDIVSFLKENGDFKLVIDAMNGTGGPYMDALYSRIAQAVGRADLYEIIHAMSDPQFGEVNNEPNPTKEKSREELVRRVSDLGGKAMGLSVDGDADRFGNVDESGEFVSANDMIALIAWFLKKEIGLDGAIGKTVATSNFVNAVAEALNIEIDEEGVGFKHFVANVIKNGRKYLVAGEESAHVAVGPFMESWDDGIVVGLMGLWIKARTGKGLVEYRDEIRKELNINTKIETLGLGEGDQAMKDQVVAMIALTNEQLDAGTVLGELSIVKRFKEQGSGEAIDIIRKDGIKLVFEDQSWILLRPSGTQLVTKFYVESMGNYAAEQEVLERRFDQLRAIGEQVAEEGLADAAMLAKAAQLQQQGDDLARRKNHRGAWRAYQQAREVLEGLPMTSEERRGQITRLEDKVKQERAALSVSWRTEAAKWLRSQNVKSRSDAARQQIEVIIDGVLDHIFASETSQAATGMNVLRAVFVQESENMPAKDILKRYLRNTAAPLSVDELIFRFRALEMVDILKIKLKERDEAMLSADRPQQDSAEAEPVGGIDFNSDQLDLKVRRDGSGVPLPMDQQVPAELMRIDGFVPVIINVAPAPNLPMMLGLADEPLDDTPRRAGGDQPVMDEPRARLENVSVLKNVKS
ncbi:MAG: hypothetical protein ACLFPX_06755 [Candidatus Omnitrophota bacterium]